MKKNLESFIKYVPIGTAIIVLLSFVSENVFYRSFNIRIASYLSLPEFIVQFLDFAMLCLIQVSMVFLVLNFANGIGWLEKMTDKYVSTKWLNTILKVITFLSPIVMLIAIIWYYDSLSTDARPKNYVSHKSMILYIIIMISGFLTYYKKIFQDFKSRLIVISIFIISYLIIFSYDSAKRVKLNNPPYNYIIYLKDKTIQTNNRLVRISKTDRFFFLYDKKDESTLVLKMENIDEILIKPNNEIKE